MLLAGELLRIQPQDAHGVHRRVRKGPVPAAGSLAHDSRQTPPLLFRRLHHADGALADDALKRGRLRPLKPVAGVQLEPGPAVSADQVHLPPLRGAVEVKDMAAALHRVAEVHRHHVDASAVLKAQAADFTCVDNRPDLLRRRDGPVL